MVGHFRFLLSRKGNHLKALGKRWCNLCFIKIMLMAVKELVRGKKAFRRLLSNPGSQLVAAEKEKSRQI